MVKTTQWYCLVVFLWTRTRHTPVFWWWKKLRAEAKSEGYCSHAGSYRITTGPWRNLCRKHTWKTVSRLWVFLFPKGYPDWTRKGRLCPLWTKVAEIGKNWKNWKMRNGLRFLELFMHMTKYCSKMHQQAWIMRKHHDQLQVRQGDQPWYPIQDRSFVAHGGSRMPCAPACKLGTVTKNWTCDKSPSEQGLPPHTHTHTLWDM